MEPFLVDPLELSVEALWTKFVVPLEKIVNRLSLVWNIVIQLKLLKDSPELSSAIEEVQVSLCPCSAILYVHKFKLTITSQSWIRHKCVVVGLELEKKKN